MEETQEGKGREITVQTTQDLTIHTETVKKELPKYWDKSYVKERIEAIQNPSHRMLLTFLWMSGCRITEAVGLQKGHLEFEHHTARLRWLKSRKYRERHIPLHPRLRDLLRVYTASMGASERVFPITRQRAWQLTRKYLGGHPHQLRHSFAVNWLRCGGDLTVLHRILGHSKIQTTMEYLKIVPVDQGRELLKIDL